MNGLIGVQGSLTLHLQMQLLRPKSNMASMHIANKQNSNIAITLSKAPNTILSACSSFILTISKSCIPSIYKQYDKTKSYKCCYHFHLSIPSLIAYANIAMRPIVNINSNAITTIIKTTGHISIARHMLIIHLIIIAVPSICYMHHLLFLLSLYISIFLAHPVCYLLWYIYSFHHLLLPNE